MELRIALDTHYLTDLFQGDTALAQWLGRCEEVWIPLVVLAEIKAGRPLHAPDYAGSAF